MGVVEVVVVMVVLVPHVMVVVMNLLLLLKRKTSVSNSIKERMEYIYVLVDFLDGLVCMYIYIDVGWKNEAYIYTLSVNIYIFLYTIYNHDIYICKMDHYIFLKKLNGSHFCHLRFLVPDYHYHQQHHHHHQQQQHHKLIRV